MTDAVSRPGFLSLPAELRNQIYALLFVPTLYLPDSEPFETTVYPDLSEFGTPIPTSPARAKRADPCVSLTLVNRQLHLETHVLYLRSTTFHLCGPSAQPNAFRDRLSAIEMTKSSCVRHLVLIAKIAHLRAMNESWDGLPFGHRDLYLETLTLIPKRPETHGSCYTEVADLSQSHTLAYVLAETLKTLRNVEVVVVRNEGCFSESVWRPVYRSLVYRLWRWGGRISGLMFREFEGADTGLGFEVLCAAGRDRQTHFRRDGWRELWQETYRLCGTVPYRDDVANA